MSRFNKVLTICLLSTLFIAGCAENPADNVSSAATTEAPPETDTPAAAADGTAYTIAAGSTIGFVGSKVTGSHEGGFKAFTGSFDVALGKVTSINVTIDMPSTWADQDKLTGHLKSADFFDVDKFAESTFKLTATTPGEGGLVNMTGNFTLHGVTKQISFPATLDVKADALTMKAEFSINRFDFGVVYAGKTNNLIRKEVVIKLDIQATKG
jgi:polyisoprenoid-binding protein YceI